MMVITIISFKNFLKSNFKKNKNIYHLMQYMWQLLRKFHRATIGIVFAPSFNNIIQDGYLNL